VKMIVAFIVAATISGVQPSQFFIQRAFQIIENQFRNQRCDEPHDLDLEESANIKEVINIAAREDPYEGATMRLSLNQLLGFQAPERLANWHATDIELFRNEIEIQLLTGFKVAREYRFAKSVGGTIGQSPPGNGLWERDLHDSPYPSAR